MPPTTKESAEAPATSVMSVPKPGDSVCDIEKFLTLEAKSREVHALRSLAPLLQVPGMIFLGGGIPTGTVFPFKNLKITLQDGREIDFTEKEARHTRLLSAGDPACSEHATSVPDTCVNTARGNFNLSKMYDMQQYGMTDKGYIPLVSWVAEHVAKVHKPPTPHEILMTCGNTNGTDLVLRTLLGRGDACLVEEFSYSSALQAMRPLGIELVGIETDSCGPIPDSIRAAFAARKQQGLPAPKVLYAIPVSCNPTGVSWTEERKAQIYALACELDFIIFDDDAYFYLQFPPAPGAEAPGLWGLGRSLLSMDTQGRVVRTDTFSKFLAPGFRLGLVAAPPLLHEKMLRTFQGSVQGASNISNIAVHRLLTLWGDDGLDAHLKMVQREYARRAGVVCAAAERHLAGLATWAPPSAGMFLWLKLGPMVDDSSKLQEAMKEMKVAVVPGKVFHAAGKPSPHFRVSFASASDEDMSNGMERLGKLLRAIESGELKPQ